MTKALALSGWQRVGVVLSALWIVIFSAYAAYHFTNSTPPENTVLVRWFDTDARVYVDDRWREEKQKACIAKCPGGDKSLDHNICEADCWVNLRLDMQERGNLERQFYWLGYSSIAVGSVIA